MSNLLKNETSPYLLQHAENPVHWYPWGEEAFQKAKKEDKPIFLSIGYSTCHWCQVMAHESFEDEKTAELLNRHFVSIKVDREERPDIDSVYMSVCQAFTGSGGWPMTIFMTWDKKLLFLTLYSEQNRDALVRYMVEKTMLHMRKGGIFDQIGYGFSRYSTDERFLAPHFEKMLYDNALLMMAYTACYRATKKEQYFEAAEKTADYVLREMMSPEGAFYSAQDADSEGVEGRFYTFTLQEILAVLGKEKGQRFAVGQSCIWTIRFCFPGTL